MKSLPASHFFAQFTGKHPSYLFAPMGALSDLGASLPCAIISAQNTQNTAKWANGRHNTTDLQM
jgi:hypothetical protein